MSPYHVLSLWVTQKPSRMTLHSSFFKSSGLEPHHQILLCHIYDASWKVLLHYRNEVGVLYLPKTTGLTFFYQLHWYFLQISIIFLLQLHSLFFFNIILQNLLLFIFLHFRLQSHGYIFLKLINSSFTLFPPPFFFRFCLNFF